MHPRGIAHHLVGRRILSPRPAHLAGCAKYALSDERNPSALGAIPKSLESSHTYRLGGPACLAGDVIGDYSFPRALRVGDILVFDDMAHYTMVKTTAFNGVKHPATALQHENGEVEVIREFRYEDFEARLS